MSEDRSLDEFEGSDGGSANDGSTDAEPTDADSTDADPTDADPADADPTDTDPADTDTTDIGDGPTPATPTATWTTGGADCERCGERVERRWLDDGDRVCPDCKSW